MRLFGKPEKATAPVEPFDEWIITTTFPNGSGAEMRGHVWGDSDVADYHRYVDGVAAGLRAAGFEVEVRKTRTVPVGDA